MNGLEFRKFEILCTLVGKGGSVAKNLDYKAIKTWLVENKYKLFGFEICSLNQFWSAEYFMRYNTDL